VVSQAVLIEDLHEVALALLVVAQRGAVGLELRGGAQAWWQAQALNRRQAICWYWRRR
jgi:hypothetical protein